MKKLVFALLLGSSMAIGAQGNKKMYFGWSGETILYQQELILLNNSIGLHYYTYKGNFFGNFDPDFSLTLKGGFDLGYKKRVYLNPRLSIQSQYKSLAWRISMVGMNQQKYWDKRISPEIGYSFENFWYIYYGYDIALDKQELIQIPHHKITLGLQFIPFKNKSLL